MAVICAIPYDFEAADFYFSSGEEFYTKYKAQLPVEEYQFEFIDGTEFELFIADKFFKEFSPIGKYFQLIESYEPSITEENLVALDYLFEFSSSSVEEVLKKLDDVTVFEGTAEEYAMEIYEDEIQAKIGFLSYHFDYKALGRELVLGGDVFEYRRKGKNYIITS